MRLKPVRGSIRGKTSDGYTATASNNEISPEVEQRAGKHICVGVFVCVCLEGPNKMVARVQNAMGHGTDKRHYSL